MFVKKNLKVVTWVLSGGKTSRAAPGITVRGPQETGSKLNDRSVSIPERKVSQNQTLILADFFLLGNEISYQYGILFVIIVLYLQSQ